MSALPSDLGPSGPDSGFYRLWRGFMTARVLIALLLLLLHASLFALGITGDSWPVIVCAGYLGVALVVRMIGEPIAPGLNFDPQWVSTIGVDIVAFSALQFLQAGGFSYAPLFALPVLLAAALGSMLLGLGAAAGVTLILLADGWLTSLLLGETASRLLQSGLTGAGLFALTLPTHQLAARLAREEQQAQRSRQAARAQALVNEMVIETLGDGVLVVDGQGMVRAANPAARQLLDARDDARTPFALRGQERWAPLLGLAQRTLEENSAQQADLVLRDAAQRPRRLQVRTRPATAQGSSADGLCVIFLEDLRQMEARLRNEKLAAMGRMSVAVAHEIRNPLAAITQANALLDEELEHQPHKELARLVRQNAQRLAQIVEEVLDVSRARTSDSSTHCALDRAVREVCSEWSRQSGSDDRLRVQAAAPAADVIFDPEHLRRVLVNLLDNALRYAGRQSGSIVVATSGAPGAICTVSVWSDGAPIDPTVEQHLFEPFFSSESRSSGLGLFICRELCERHGAQLAYRRTPTQEVSGAGNEFSIALRTPGGPSLREPGFDSILA